MPTYTCGCASESPHEHLCCINTESWWRQHNDCNIIVILFHSSDGQLSWYSLEGRVKQVKLFECPAVNRVAVKTKNGTSSSVGWKQPAGTSPKFCPPFRQFHQVAWFLKGPSNGGWWPARVADGGGNYQNLPAFGSWLLLIFHSCYTSRSQKAFIVIICTRSYFNLLLPL